MLPLFRLASNNGSEIAGLLVWVKLLPANRMPSAGLIVSKTVVSETVVSEILGTMGALSPQSWHEQLRPV